MKFKKVRNGSLLAEARLRRNAEANRRWRQERDAAKIDDFFANRNLREHGRFACWQPVPIKYTHPNAWDLGLGATSPAAV